MAASAGAAGVVAGVLGADVAVVPAIGIAAAAAAGAVSMPTLHSGFHRTRCQSGEDTYCTQGTGETHDTVQRHWVNPMGYVLSTWKTTRK